MDDDTAPDTAPDIPPDTAPLEHVAAIADALLTQLNAFAAIQLRLQQLGEEASVLITPELIIGR